MSHRRALFLATLLAGTAAAQCPVSQLVAEPYGSTCGSSGPQVHASFWAPTCEVQVQLWQPQFQFSVPIGGWLAFGLTPELMVYHGLGRCPLPADPIAIASVADVLTIRIPPGLSPMTFWVHGLAIYFDFSINSTFLLPAVQGMQVMLLQ